METYGEKVMEHFMHPKNMGEIKAADGIGKVGNFACGDIMWLYIKVKANKITDIKFKTLGCAAAIATSSMITELAKGKTLEEGLQITKQNIVDKLGGLPKPKIHCSVLASDALAEAIYDYMSKKKMPIAAELEQRHQRIKKTLEMTEEKAGHAHDEADERDMKITKELTLGEIIKKYPKSGAIMSKYGLHCIGCHVSTFETLEQGCRAHGITSKKFDELLKELNKAAV